MLGKLLLLAFFGFLMAFTLQLLLAMGVNKRVYNHRPGHCEEVKGIKHGSEDIVLIESLGIAFISSGLFYMFERVSDVRGKIFSYNFTEPEVKAVEVTIRGFDRLESFRPHGLSFIETGGVLRLFVINHEYPSFTHSVEVFRYNKQRKELIFEKTVRDEKFIRPNDLVAISADSFILSNDGYSQTSFGNMFEVLSGARVGSIVYFDGRNSHYIQESSASPNGVILDRTRKFLLVSEINYQQIAIYKLGEDLKSMALVQTVPLNSLPDNMFIDNAGAVWVGAHPIAKDAAGHMANSDDLTQYGPSQILKIELSDDWKTWEITEIYADDGRQLSASSIAVHHMDQLLLGSVFRQLVHCRISDKNVLRGSLLLTHLNYYLMETSDPILRRLPSHVRAGAVLLGGLFSMLSFGTVYTFGNMLPYMVSYLRWKVDPTMKAGSMIWLQTLLSGVPFAMIAGGVLERRMGGKRAAILGSLMYTGGTAMTFITIQKSYGLMLLSMGLVASFGGSIAYNAILTTAQKWFPQNVGMASGIIVGGYGCGAFILSPLQTSYINPLDYRVNAEGYFTQEDLLERVPYVFLVMATVYFLLQTVGITFVGAPKEDFDETDQLISENHSQPLSAQLKSVTFIVLFISLTLNSLWVQIVSGLYKAYGQQFIYSDMFLSFVGSLSSIANAGSRIIWGVVVDKSSYQTCMCIVTGMAACSIWLLPTIKWIGNDMVFLISICTMFSCIGGTYSLFPYITNRCFGKANFGVVYGTLQTALCVAGIFAGFLCQFLLPEIGFEKLFIIAGFCMAASFGLTVVLHKTDMAESSSQYSLVSTEE